jgi:Flp pilus assembly pilin Flp
VQHPSKQTIGTVAAGLDEFPSRAGRARDDRKEVTSNVMFTDLIHYLRARFAGEEGQTMAEYGVVLAVIAIGVVVALGLLSGAISTAIGNVIGYL